jgi:DNA processing protein
MAEPITSDVLDHLALALIPGLGPKLTAALLERFGTAAAARAATTAQLQEIPHIGERTADSFAAALRTVNLEPEVRLLKQHGAQVIPRGYAGYPAPVAGLVNPPGLLYFRGEWTTADLGAVAIVGSRGCTAYGRKIAEQIARGLARAGITVVSGLARGIDACAHRGALDGGGRTIAVLGGGLAKIYPPEHEDLARDVANCGCLISETPMTMEPQPGMFPARNRIISGLSRAVVVIEANAKSGSLITARHAGEQGREVFAVPGAVDSPTSAGCLELLRAGARLVRSADDILEDLRGIAAPWYQQETPELSERKPVENEQQSEKTLTVTPAPPLPSLDPEQQRVYDQLASRQHFDELTRTLGLPVNTLSRVLMQLEMKRMVRRQPGNYFERR